MLLFYSHQVEHIHKNVYYIICCFQKNSMFHENYVNDIKCFCHVTKQGLSIPNVCQEILRERVYSKQNDATEQSSSSPTSFQTHWCKSNYTRATSPSTLLLTLTGPRALSAGTETSVLVKACYLLSSQGIWTCQKRSDHHTSSGKEKVLHSCNQVLGFIKAEISLRTRAAPAPRNSHLKDSTSFFSFCFLGSLTIQS